MIEHHLYPTIGSAVGWLVAAVMRTALGVHGEFLVGRSTPGASLVDGITVRALLASLTGAIVLPAEIIFCLDTGVVKTCGFDLHSTMPRCSICRCLSL